MNRHLIYIAATVVLAILSVLLGYAVGIHSKRAESLKGSPLGIWLGGLLSVAVGGFAKGIPIGSSSGGILATTSHNVYGDLSVRHVLIELAFLLAAPCGTALVKIDSYIEANPLPNIFASGPNANGPSPTP